MSSKRKSDAGNTSSSKKSRKAITLEVKHEILNLHKSGMKVNELAAKFKMSHSTVSTILKDKQKYLDQVKSAMPMQSTVVRKREGLIPEVEKVLIAWINHQTQTVHMPLDQPTISAKALSVFETIKNQRGETAKDETFNASRGWFDRFRKRAGLHNIRVQGEAASADIAAAKDYPKKLAEIIEEGGYCSRLVFNVDETGLFWKRMPSRSYISKEEKSIPGFKVAKDRLTLLLGANAAGDCKLKPLLIYRAENPRALKGLVKTTLPVIWKSNSRAWMTATIFEDWLSHHFVPEVKKYCADNDLPFKAMLIMDNAPGHAAILQHHHPNIKIIFMPPKTTPLLQPMDQGVIASFKAYYLRRTFQKLIRTIDKESGSTVREVWKKFNVLDAVKIIKDAWNEVTETNLKGVWKKLCPQFVQDSGGFENPVENVTETVVEIANRLELEVSPEDVTEFLNANENEPSNEDLIQMVEQGVIDEEDEEEVEEAATHPGFTNQRLSDAFGHIQSALKIFETDDPNFESSSKVLAAIRNDFACYREIYHQKKKTSSVQKSLEYFFQKPQPVNPMQKSSKETAVSTKPSQVSTDSPQVSTGSPQPLPPPTLHLNFENSDDPDDPLPSPSDFIQTP